LFFWGSHMIEVEKKFKITKEDEKRLIDGADFLGIKKIEDTYYDSKDYSLTKQGKWLRRRDGEFEIKLPLGDGAGGFDQYDEIKGADAVAPLIGIEPRADLEQALLEKGYVPFIHLITTRSKYKRGDFSIDIDFVDFGDFAFEIAEIELLIEDQNAMSGAVARIAAFAGKNELAVSPVRGKVVEFLYRKRPDHYHALYEAGVIHGSS